MTGKLKLGLRLSCRILAGERSGLLTRTAAIVNGSLCTRALRRHRADILLRSAVHRKTLQVALMTAPLLRVIDGPQHRKARKTIATISLAQSAP